MVAKKKIIRANSTYIATSDSCLLRSIPKNFGLTMTSPLDIGVTGAVVVVVIATVDNDVVTSVAVVLLTVLEVVVELEAAQVYQFIA